MEHFSNLSCSCPLHEQPKDEIILLATVHVCLVIIIEENILLATLTHVLPL